VRELDGYVGAMLRHGHQVPEPNPLRPEIVGNALVRAIAAVAERPETRKLLSTEIARVMSGLLRQTYVDIIEDLRNAGITPLGLTVRVAPSPYPPPQENDAADSEPVPAMFQTYAVPQRYSQAPFGGDSGPAEQRSTRPVAGTPIGRVADQVMSVLRRLAVDFGGAPSRQVDAAHQARHISSTPASGYGGSAPARYYGGSSPEQAYIEHRQRYDNEREQRNEEQDPGFDGDDGGGAQADEGAWDDADAAPPTNVIVQRREELRQAATGAVDHQVIDIVGALFDQILSDPKVPPQMARLIARLQLPVLRAALGDPSFFSSRNHPVRRFVNRIASLACAYDDFRETGAAAFLELVGELVQEVVSGDFDRIEIYEQKIEVLEGFIREQTRRDMRSRGDADELLARKETEALTQEAYARQLETALGPLAMPNFIRWFISHLWSRAITKAATGDPPDLGMADRLRRAGRNLIMSVQPKGSPAQRKAFLIQLPELMRDLTAGLDLIALPESERKSFFGQLLPAHAESLKGVGMRTLDYNLLAREIDDILVAALPSATPPSHFDAIETSQVAASPQHASFTEEEAQRLGLVDEGRIDRAAALDIDLSAEPEIHAVDIGINIDGVPPPDPVEPSRGRSLADHMQLGQAYWMNVEDGWHKVRLAHASPGRTFFVFTRGQRHKTTITVTARVLVKLCDGGRLRAFEVAGLIERATARARLNGFETQEEEEPY
jgi:hypothetical protein